MEEGAGLDGRIVARCPPVLRDTPAASGQHPRHLRAAFARRALDARADLSFGIVELPDLLGREHLGKAVHIVALDLRHGGDVGQALLQHGALARIVGRHRIGDAAHGALQRLAIGGIDRIEDLALASRKVQQTDHLLTGGGIQFIERLTSGGRLLEIVDGRPNVGHGLPHRRVGGGSLRIKRRPESDNQQEHLLHGKSGFQSCWLKRISS